ncbi:hypothetical protein Tco_1262605 [Tanacetum coccineum]
MMERRLMKIQEKIVNIKKLNGAREADINNLDTTIQVSPIPATRIHKDHPLDQVIGDLQSATQTRRMSKNLEEHGKNPKRRGVCKCQPPGFEDPDFPDRVYKVEKHKAKKSVRLMMKKLFGMELELILVTQSDSLVRAATTASSLEAEQDSGNITKTQSKETPNEARFPRNYFRWVVPGAKETRLQQRVLDLEKTKTTQANEIDSLKMRVKKLERKDRSRTHGLKRLHKVDMSRRVESSRDEDSLCEDASKQGMRINAIDADEDITLVNVQDDAEMFDVNTLTGDEVFAEQEVAAKDVNLTIDEVTLAQAPAALKSIKPKVKGVVIHGSHLPTTTTIFNNNNPLQTRVKGIDGEETEDMDQDSAHMVAASKVPMLKPGEFELWRIRIEQYIQMIDYALWEVIENGATLPKTAVVEGVEKLKFNSIKDAKLLLEAVEKRFGWSATTKKTQRNLLNLNKLIECQIVDNYKKGLGYEKYNAVPPPYTGNFMPPTPDLSFTGLDEFVNKPVVENRKSDEEASKKTVKPSIAKIEFVKPKQQKKTARKTVKQVEKNSFDHLQVDCNYHQKQFQNQRMVKLVWNNAQRVNHQNFAKKTHPCAKNNLVPGAVLMESGLVSIINARQNISKTVVSVNIARQVNTAHPKTTVNAARPMSYLSKTAHSTVKRPIHKNTALKNSNIDQRVNTVSGKKFNTARPKAVVNAVKGNNVNAVKASA